MRYEESEIEDALNVSKGRGWENLKGHHQVDILRWALIEMRKEVDAFRRIDADCDCKTGVCASAKGKLHIAIKDMQDTTAQYDHLLKSAENVGACSMLTYGTYEHVVMGSNITGPMVVCAPREISELEDAVKSCKR